jgi:hypothetical protein
MDMHRDSGGSRDGQPRQIEISLRELGQLFNTMDPSPFHEKDLDADAEEFIVSWAREFPSREPVVLVIHLSQMPNAQHPAAEVERAVRHYFAYRAKLTQLEFRRLMKEGRQSLVIGLGFLAVCLVGSELLGGGSPGPMLQVVRESLTIAGWVAMWHPMQIYLYEWWPIRRRGRIYTKMSRMKVEIHQRT